MPDYLRILLPACILEDGSPYNQLMVFHVEDDSITARQLNNFIYGNASQGTTIPTSVFTTPYYVNYSPEFTDTMTATITAEELMVTYIGMSNGIMTAKRLEGANSGKIHLADNSMVANKVFERWSDRSRWTT